MQNIGCMKFKHFILKDLFLLGGKKTVFAVT